MEPEVGVQRPDRRRHEVEDIVGVERHSVRIADMRLATGPQEVDERHVAVAHCFRLHPFHLQMGIQHVAEEKRLAAWQQRPEGDRKQNYRRHDVGQCEASAGLPCGLCFVIRQHRGDRL